MSVFPYIEMNLVAFAICAIVFLNHRKGKNLVIGVKTFDRMLRVMYVILVCNILSWLVQADLIPHTYWLHMGVLCIYFIGQIILPILLLQFYIETNRKRPKIGIISLYSMPLIITISLLFVNCFTPILFSLDEKDHYQRESGFLILGGMALLYLVGCTYMTIKDYFFSDWKNTNTKTCMIFSIIALLSGIIGTLIYGFEIWPLIALDIMYMYLSLHAKRETLLDSMVYIDTLTGVKNSAAYKDRINQIESLSTIADIDYAVISIDVNELKHINDTYGHDAGNKMIIAAANYICQSFLQESVYRIGGDEFAVIMEDLPKFKFMLQRFDEKMEENEIEIDSKILKFQMARGVSIHEAGSGMSYEEIFKIADEKMYEDKIEKKKREKVYMK